MMNRSMIYTPFRKAQVFNSNFKIGPSLFTALFTALFTLLA